MKKEKKHSLKWTWRDYLLQLSVVIAGIMVTFVGSGLISRWSQQRQVKAVMQLVVEELKTNREAIAHTCGALNYDRAGMLMFDRYGKNVDSIPTDSLKRYMYILGQVRGLALQVDAIEVLKTSGLIPAISDKELLMQLLATYRTIDAFRETVDLYNQRKLDAINHFFSNTYDARLSEDDPRASWKSLMSNPLCMSFMGTSAFFFGDADYLHSDIGSIDAVISAIDKKYDLE